MRDGVIAAPERLEEHVPEPREREYLLNNNRASEQIPELHRQQRYDDKQAVLQQVAAENIPEPDAADVRRSGIQTGLCIPEGPVEKLHQDGPAVEGEGNQREGVMGGCPGAEQRQHGELDGKY